MIDPEILATYHQGTYFDGCGSKPMESALKIAGICLMFIDHFSSPQIWYIPSGYGIYHLVMVYTIWLWYIPSGYD